MAALPQRPRRRSSAPLLRVLTALGLTNTERGYYTITIATNAGLAQDYTATATPVAGGPQSHDTKCTSLSLDNTGQRTSTGTVAATECWK